MPSKFGDDGEGGQDDLDPHPASALAFRHPAQDPYSGSARSLLPCRVRVSRTQPSRFATDLSAFIEASA
jgi:hypothetical protein